ncbi:MAG: sulfite exporter TauE/SafE family protein [Sphingomonadaceae bacterium]|nr:sulfite exporter TauE/SafE family protein [Sphingomonadaceae bacterium]
MSSATAAFLILTAFLTALLSGIFGMAGGLVLMGAMALVLPVSAAFVTHGLLQLVANGWRAVLHRRHIAWPVLWNYALASAVAAAIVAAIGFVPSKPVLFLLLGLVPMLVWVPKSWLQLDASRTPHALVSGFLVTGLNLSAGVAGPLLDIFFVRTSLNRHQIVATKAATQIFSHLAKIVVYGAPLLAIGGGAMPPWWVFALAIPASMLGTTAGGWVLDRLSDANFKRWTAWIVTAIGLFYLWKAWEIWF